MKPSTGVIAIVFLAVAAALGAPGTQSESVYTFKGNRLGEPLEEFRSDPRNASDVYLNTGNPNARKVDKKKTIHWTEPICSDKVQALDFGMPKPVYDGEIVCSIKNINDNSANEVMGEPATALTYSFIGGLLYQIHMMFPSISYPVMKSAFVGRYGPATKTGSDAYQNGYGARWTGEHLFWKQGDQTILMMEGSGNGPGQDDMNPSNGGMSISFTDDALLSKNLKQAPKKPDF